MQTLPFELYVFDWSGRTELAKELFEVIVIGISLLIFITVFPNTVLTVSMSGILV